MGHKSHNEARLREGFRLRETSETVRESASYRPVYGARETSEIARGREGETATPSIGDRWPVERTAKSRRAGQCGLGLVKE